MEERRRYVRIDLCIEVEYKVLREEKVSGGAKSKNISEGGMCFLARDKLKKNTLLALKFHLPDRKISVIDCKGKVIWQSKEGEGYLTGIEFIDLDTNSRFLIKTFVSRFMSELLDYGLR